MTPPIAGLVLCADCGQPTGKRPRVSKRCRVCSTDLNRLKVRERNYSERLRISMRTMMREGCW